MRIGSSLRVALWAALVAQARARNVSPNPNNAKFDPDAAESQSVTCNIPPYADMDNQFQDSPEMCQTPDTSLTVEDARALAVTYAPRLVFHPLEKYTLTNVDDAFADPNAGEIRTTIRTTPVFHDTINLTSMLYSTRDLQLGSNSNKYYFTHNKSLDMYLHDLNDPLGYLRGSGYDEDGKANAPIYYRVFDLEMGHGQTTTSFITDSMDTQT